MLNVRSRIGTLGLINHNDAMSQGAQGPTGGSGGGAAIARWSLQLVAIVTVGGLLSLSLAANGRLLDQTRRHVGASQAHFLSQGGTCQSGS